MRPGWNVTMRGSFGVLRNSMPSWVRKFLEDFPDDLARIVAIEFWPEGSELKLQIRRKEKEAPFPSLSVAKVKEGWGIAWGWDGIERHLAETFDKPPSADYIAHLLRQKINT